jgi:hypothetical protein
MSNNVVIGFNFSLAKARAPYNFMEENNTSCRLHHRKGKQDYDRLTCDLDPESLIYMTAARGCADKCPYSIMHSALSTSSAAINVCRVIIF